MRNKEKLLWTAAIGVVSLVGCRDGSGPSDQPTPPPELPKQTQVDIEIPPIGTETKPPSIPPTVTPINEQQFHQEVEIESTPESSADQTPNEHPETRESLTYRVVDWDALNLIDPVNVQRWESFIVEFANKYDIPPEVIAAIIDTESHGRTDGEWAINPNDGVGLMGVKPYELGFVNRPLRQKLLDPKTNIDWGTSIFWEIYNNPQMGNENFYDALLWYNAGLQENLEYAIPYADAIYDKLGWPHPDEIPDRLEDNVYE